MKSLADYARAKDPPEGSDEEEAGEDEAAPGPGELAAVDDLASALGVEVKDRDAAAAALQDFVRLCLAKDRKGAYDGGDEEGSPKVGLLLVPKGKGKD